MNKHRKTDTIRNCVLGIRQCFSILYCNMFNIYVEWNVFFLFSYMRRKTANWIKCKHFIKNLKISNIYECKYCHKFLFIHANLLYIFSYEILSLTSLTFFVTNSKNLQNQELEREKGYSLILFCIWILRIAICKMEVGCCCM